MDSEQDAVFLGHPYLADLELKVDGLSKAMEGLRSAGLASEEEADAFADCIEDLWIRIISLRHALHQDGACADQGRGSLSAIVSTLRLLEGDLTFARERMHP